MSDLRAETALPRPLVCATDELFAWSGRGIVLLGELSEGRWIVARGWREGDRLTDVRRWSFAESQTFTRQFRRLTFDATDDVGLASLVGEAASDWVAHRNR
jgi:hypothetical protein